MKVAISGQNAAAAYSQAFQELKKLPGFSIRTLIRAEAGSILKAWAGRVKVTTVEKTERRMRSGIAWKMGIQSSGGNNPFQVTVNDGSRQGTRGDVWFKTRNDKFQQAGRVTDTGAFIPAWTHFRAADWAKINQAGSTYAGLLRNRRKAVMASIGLNRQSVLQIADSLGIDLMNVPGGKLSFAALQKARDAEPSNGRFYQNGTGAESSADDAQTKYYVQLINRLPYNRKTGMDNDLAWVLSNRANYIRQTFAHNAGKSITNVVARFPNILKVSGVESVPTQPAE